MALSYFQKKKNTVKKLVKKVAKSGSHMMPNGKMMGDEKMKGMKA